jgi:hypothetical protein
MSNAKIVKSFSLATLFSVVVFGFSIPLPAKAQSLQRFGNFQKPGNNGSVSCDTFCGAAKANGQPVWGDRIGINIGSDQPKGAAGICECRQPSKANQSCMPSSDGSRMYCSPAAIFVKHGNNGTVSCDTYCRGSQWGQVGTCVASFDNKNGTGRDGNYLPGFLDGAELTCTCVKR